MLVHKNTALNTLADYGVCRLQTVAENPPKLDAILNFSMVARGNLKQAFTHFPYSYFATKYHGASKQARIGFDIVLSGSEDDKNYCGIEIDYAETSGAEAGTPGFQIFTNRLSNYQ